MFLATESCFASRELQDADTVLPGGRGSLPHLGPCFFPQTLPLSWKTITEQCFVRFNMQTQSWRGGGRLARDLPWPSFSPCLWPSPKVLEFESHWARLPFDLIPSCVRISFITYLLGDTRMNKVPFLPLELFNKVEEWPSPDMALWSAGDVVVKEQTVGDQGSLPRGGNNRNELMRMKRTWSGEKVEAERGRREF